MSFSMTLNRKKSYGLQKKPAQKKNIFAQEEDGDDEEEEKAPSWEEMQNRKKRKIEEEQLQNALAEDPSVFEFDEVYDQMKDSTKKKAPTKKKDVEPQYYHAMQARAKNRELEMEEITARVKRKEIDRDKEIYGETDEYITPTYKKRLEQIEQWKKEQAELDHKDQKREKNMTGFYQQYLEGVTEGRGAPLPSSSSLPSSPSSPPSSPTPLSPKREEESKPVVLQSGLNRIAKPKMKEETEERGDRRDRGDRGDRWDRRDRGHRERNFADSSSSSSRKEEVKKIVKDTKNKYLQRNDEKSIEAARQRYLERKRKRQSGS